jgi:hypothetical protein
VKLDNVESPCIDCLFKKRIGRIDEDADAPDMTWNWPA